MRSHPKPDHNRASITLYYVVALSTKRKLKNTITRAEAAQVLADILEINHRAPESWMRGNFRKHPISRENFLRFVRAYRTKPGLESPTEITALAIDLYGSDYKRAVELLDPADRESDPAQDVMLAPPGKANLATAICNLIESSSPEEVKSTLVTMLSSISGL
jgi:hypothetical protein